MPEEITLEDGTTKTVYSQEEVDGLQKGSDKNKERKEAITSLEKSLDLKEGQTVEQKLEEMKETSNPNFAKYRAKHKAMEKALKDEGKQFDDNGTPITNNQPLSSEDIQKQIDEKVNEVVNNVTGSTAKNEALSKFTKEDQDVIKPHLDKLMTAYPNDLQDNLGLAVQKAFPTNVPDAVKQTLSSAGGAGPIIKNSNEKDKFTGTDEGKTMLSKILPPDVKKAIAAKNKTN